MTIQEKIGQCLVGGFPSTSMSPEIIRAIKEYKLGNIILFRENIESVEQLKRLCAEIQALVMQETGAPAFITLDQEGGAVTRLPEGEANIPGAMALAATGDPQNAYRAGLLTGQELRSLGVNFNLAPVMDVNSNPKNPIIGARSYGDTPETVSRYGTQMIRGLLDGGVLAAAKHFPGHGDTSVDSHVDLPCVDKSIEELERMELAPFRAAIAAGVPAIMSTHVLFPRLEKEHVPATMSRAIMTGLLREKLGFTGLTISDCMQMSAIQRFYGTVSGVVAAIHAGVDLVFVSHSAPLLCQAAETVQKHVESGNIPMEWLDASVARILAYKERFAIGAPIAGSFDRDAAIAQCDHLRRLTLTVVQNPKSGRPALGQNPLFVGCSAYNTGLIGNVVEDVRATFPELLSRRLGGDHLNSSVDPSDDEINVCVTAVKKHTAIVCCTYNGHLHPGQMKLLKAVTSTGVPAMAIALRNPYDLRDLDENVWALEAYEYTTPAAQAVADVLAGKAQATGKLSIKW